MSTKEKILSYLVNLNVSYEEVDTNTFLINDDEKSLRQVFVYTEDPLTIIRVNVMSIPKERSAELFEELLKLNASDLISCAYAVENNFVILINTMLSETLDFEEFQAALDSIGLALSQHYENLSKYIK